jgi:hypothetical protein
MILRGNTEPPISLMGKAMISGKLQGSRYRTLGSVSIQAFPGYVVMKFPLLLSQAVALFCAL